MLSRPVLPRDEQSSRRGAILVLSVILMVAMFGFLAFTVDIGYMEMTKAQAQNTADAGALAGVTELAQGNPTGINPAVQAMANANQVAGTSLTIASNDIVTGTFNDTTHVFTPGPVASANAVQVTPRLTNGKALVSRVLGNSSFNMTASAVAKYDAKDIVFVVDLSGSMNDDTEPVWATSALNTDQGCNCNSGSGGGDDDDDDGHGGCHGDYGDSGSDDDDDNNNWSNCGGSSHGSCGGSRGGQCGGRHGHGCDGGGDGNSSSNNCGCGPDGKTGCTGNVLAQKLYTHLGHGTFPGVKHHCGESLGIICDDRCYGDLTMDNGPLTKTSITASCRIANTDSEATRKNKCHKWLITNQIAVDMPNAQPTPNTTTNFNYWSKYLDYVMPSITYNGNNTQSYCHPGSGCGISGTVSSCRGMPRNGATTSCTLPVTQSKCMTEHFFNPNTTTYGGSSQGCSAASCKIGYQTYTQFCCDHGRDRDPEADSDVECTTTKNPLSVKCPTCPMHSEAVDGQNFDFPPAEEPIHSCRRGLISAIKKIKDANIGKPADCRDRVSVITFDRCDANHAPCIHKELGDDYDGCLDKVRKLQGCSDYGASTGTEAGLECARNHVKNSGDGGCGRAKAHKVVVLITDGIPTCSQSSASATQTYCSGHPNGDHYDSTYNHANAALNSIDKLKGEKVDVHVCSHGHGRDDDFCDRAARTGGKDVNGQCHRGHDDPAQYETTIKTNQTTSLSEQRIRLVK